MTTEPATTTAPTASTVPDGPGKGQLQGYPLEFELDGKNLYLRWACRWSVQLATVFVNGGKSPIKNKDGEWEWRDATTDELSAATKLVNKIADKLRAKAEATAAKVAARATGTGKAPPKRKVKTETAVEATVYRFLLKSWVFSLIYFKPRRK
jgi:hypothetical protein